MNETLSDADKAELILRGHCAECFSEPGAHQYWCRTGFRERTSMTLNALVCVISDKLKQHIKEYESAKIKD